MSRGLCNYDPIVPLFHASEFLINLMKKLKESLPEFDCKLRIISRSGSTHDELLFI